jgi:hypothetical protein
MTRCRITFLMVSFYRNQSHQPSSSCSPRTHNTEVESKECEPTLEIGLVSRTTDAGGVCHAHDRSRCHAFIKSCRTGIQIDTGLRHTFCQSIISHTTNTTYFMPCQYRYLYHTIRIHSYRRRWLASDSPGTIPSFCSKVPR